MGKGKGIVEGFAYEIRLSYTSSSINNYELRAIHVCGIFENTSLLCSSNHIDLLLAIKFDYIVSEYGDIVNTDVITGLYLSKTAT